MTNEIYAEEIRKLLDQYGKQENRICAMLGLELIECDCECEKPYADFLFEPKEWMLNPYDGVHGGLICSAFDTCMGTGALALRRDFISTTDITISYIKAMTGKRQRIHCEYTQVGKRLIRIMAKAIDMDTGLLSATAMASFTVIKAQGNGLKV